MENVEGVAVLLVPSDQLFGAGQDFGGLLRPAAHIGKPDGIGARGPLQPYTAPSLGLEYVHAVGAFDREITVPTERAFLFASAVMAVGLVALVGLLAATVMLWGIGIGPTFTS